MCGRNGLLPCHHHFQVAVGIFGDQEIDIFQTSYSGQLGALVNLGLGQSNFQVLGFGWADVTDHKTQFQRLA